MRVSRTSAYVIVAVLSAVPLACSSGDSGKKDAPSAGEAAPSQRPHLQWKRYAAIEADLSAALDLPAEELCTEFGLESCITGVHLAPLGGNDPFKTGLLEPSSEALTTTPAVIDRLLLSACSRRVTRDRDAGKASSKVFMDLDLNGQAPEPDDASTKATITALYRRLLARNPLPSEVTRVASLTRDGDEHPVSASEFATLACYAIGTTAEAEFY
jgi:hypothetical protein